MPIYEYRCNEENGGCGHEFEILQKMTEGAKRKCPKCGKNKLIKLLGVPGLKFVGSGFFVNDYPKETPPSKSE